MAPRIKTLSRPATGSLSLRNWKTIRACAKGSSDLRGIVDGTFHGRKLNANNNLCIYIYIYIYIHPYIFTFIHICIYTYIHLCIYIHIYIYTFILLYIYTFLHLYIYTCIYTFIYVYMYIYIYINIYLHIAKRNARSESSLNQSIQSHVCLMNHPYWCWNFRWQKLGFMGICLGVFLKTCHCEVYICFLYLSIYIYIYIHIIDGFKDLQTDIVTLWQTYTTMENGHRHSEFSHQKWWFKL